MKAKKNFIGLEGFIWWVGVVEDRQDPEQLNRVRVRCFGWHTENKEKIPTDSLPWAHPVIPVNSPAAYNPKEGDMVFGFFLDGEQAQNPVVVGVLPGKPEKKPDYEKGFSDPGTELNKRPKRPDDASEKYPKQKYLKESTVTRLARNKAEGTVIKTRKDNTTKNISSAGGVTWSEPNPAYEPKYPYNYAHETESGHAFEMDDTPGKERLHLAHRIGSYFEINAEGSKAEKIIKDNYTLVMGSDYVYVSGKCSVTVDGDCNLRVGGNMNIEVAGQINMSAGQDIRMKGKNVFFESTGDMSLKSAGAIAMESAGAMSVSGGSTAVLQAGSKASVKGSSVALSGSDVSVDGTLKAGSTNLKATGKDSGSNGGSDHNLNVAGSGGSSADSATAAAATGLDAGGSSASQEEKETAQSSKSESSREGKNENKGSIDTALTSNTATSNTPNTAPATTAGSIASVSQSISGSSMGKTISGITETAQGALQQVTSSVNKAAQLLGQTTKLSELNKVVTDAQNTINAARGAILGSTSGNIKDLLGTIDTVKTLAGDKNIPFDIDRDIVNAIDIAKNGLGNVDYETIVGKRLYPKTEFLKVALDETGNT